MSPVCFCVAFLFEGTAEVALQNLTVLADYAQEKKKFESGVKFSVEQVSLFFNVICLISLWLSCFLQSFRFSCNGCKHRPRSYWPPFPKEVVILLCGMLNYSLHPFPSNQVLGAHSYLTKGGIWVVRYPTRADKMHGQMLLFVLLTLPGVLSTVT